MIFTEIALEGVKNFRKQCRFVFKRGYNLVYGPNESGKTTLLDCMCILIDPMRQVGESEGYASWGPPGNSRTGLVITEGNQTFRVTRDFVNGMVSLSKFDPQTKKFDTVTQDHSQVEAFLRQQIKMPPIDIYRKIFVFNKTDMPTGRPKVMVQKVAASGPPPGAGMDAGYGSPGAGMPGMPPMPAAPPPGQGMRPEEIKQRIEELKKQFEAATKADKVQYEIDGLESKLFDMEGKTKEIKSMEQKVEQMESSLKPLQSFQDLPPDIVKRIEFFEDVQKEHNQRVNEVESRLGKAKVAHDAVANREPFFKEQNFIIGVAAIVVGIIIHAAAPDTIPFIKVLPPLVILVGLGFAFWVLWNEFSVRAKEGELAEQMNKADEELREEVKKFEVEGSVIKRLMAEAGAEDPKDLHSKLKEYKKRVEMIDELNEKIKKTKKDIDYDKLESEKEELKKKIEELNRELQTGSGGGFVQDPADIQRQIDALQYALDNPGVAPPSAAVPPGMPYGGGMPPVPGPTTPPAAPPDMTMPSGNPGPPVPSGGGGDDYLGGGGDDYLGGGGGMDYAMSGSPPMAGAPDQTMVSGGSTPSGGDSGQVSSGVGGIDTMVDELWTAAEKLSGMDRSTLIMQLGDKFNMYLQAFTGKKYNEGDLSSEKTVSLRSDTGSYVDLKDLSPSTQDAAWLALKIALIETLYQKIRLPVLLDDPLRNLDDSRLAMVSKALKRIGSGCQVLLITTQRVHSKIADNTVNIVPTPPQ